MHPVRKLARAMERRCLGEADTVDVAGMERDISRHVKPLLDVLEELPSIALGCTGPGNTFDQAQGYSDACREIAAKIRHRVDPLLSAWRVQP